MIHKDQVWETIKNDKTTIYGQSMIDVFLQTTTELSERHFLELDKNQINLLTGDVIYDLLYYAKDIKKIADLIGQNINKISENHVYTLLQRDRTERKDDKYLRTDAILQYKNINNDKDIRSLIFYSTSTADGGKSLGFYEPNINDLKNIIKRIGDDKLSYLHPRSVYDLLKHFLSKDENADAFEFFAKSLKDNINKIPPDKVGLLIPAQNPNFSQQQIIHLEKVLKLLGSENLNKLEDKDIKNLLIYGSSEYTKKLGELLGEIRDKLSDESVDEIFDHTFSSRFNDPDALSKMIDVIGLKRSIKFFNSPQGKQTIDEMKRAIENGKDEIKKNKESWKQNSLLKNLNIKEQMLESLYERLKKLGSYN